jgi:hypothetical protein
MKDVTYGPFVCMVRPEKAESNQMGFTVLPRQCSYPNQGNAGGQMLFNSDIYTKGAHFTTMDISNFYPMTHLHQPEFIQIKLNDIPDEVVD